VSVDSECSDGDDLKGEKGGQETRTTGSEGQSCRYCGGPIAGRRRNGYCSDRCRMKDRRQKQAEGHRQLIADLRAVVDRVDRVLMCDPIVADGADHDG
jgi:predicted nucleic acid-binding Zn ribbon protein